MTSTRLDRLSAVLDGLAPQITVRFAGHLSGPDQFEADAPDFLRLHLITAGSAWLELPNGERQRLSAPSIAALRSDFRHALSPVDAGIAPVVMCIEARFDGPVATLLLDAFNDPLLMPLEESKSELDLVVRLIAFELTQPRCGQPALLTRAGDILFIGLLRHLLAHPRSSIGLLSGLADQSIARVLVAIHSAPHKPWSLEAMAQEAGMSRTAFANHFRDTVSHTPGSYLTLLRLSIAQRVVDNGKSLKQAARQSGYASTTALSRALSRNRAGFGE